MGESYCNTLTGIESNYESLIKGKKDMVLNFGNIFNIL